jgi:hypothetical protein
MTSNQLNAPGTNDDDDGSIQSIGGKGKHNKLSRDLTLEYMPDEAPIKGYHATHRRER